MNSNNGKTIEVEGRTVQEAISKGLQLLKVSRDRVLIQVLSEESRGLFGMRGVKLSKVRLTLKG